MRSISSSWLDSSRSKSNFANAARKVSGTAPRSCATPVRNPLRIAVATTAVGAGGGPPTQGCSDCVNMSVQGACQGPVSTCLNDAACSQMITCHQQCGWTPDCKQQCDVGSSVGNFDTLMGCLLCTDCGMFCAGSEVFNEYCTFPPPL